MLVFVHFKQFSLAVSGNAVLAASCQVDGINGNFNGNMVINVSKQYILP